MITQTGTPQKKLPRFFVTQSEVSNGNGQILECRSFPRLTRIANRGWVSCPIRVSFWGLGQGQVCGGGFANRFGRKTGIFTVVLLSCVFGCLNSVAWNYWSYTIIRTLVGFASSGVGLIGFILSSEPLGLEWRGWAGVMNQCFFPIGEMIIAFIAIFVSDWRLLNFVSGLTQGFYLLLIPFMLESPRWQLVEGKKEQALMILQKIAKMNNTQVPQGDLVDTTAQHSSEHQKVSLKDVFKHKTLSIRMLILIYGWTISCMVYYGVQLNLGALGGSLAVNIFLMGLVEFISYLFGAVIVEKAGRGFVVAWGIFLSGFSSFVIGSVSSHTLQIVFSLIGKFCASLAFGTIFAYTVELFPTVVRSTCLGACSLSARVGGLLAPLVVIVGTYCGMVVVYSIFGTTAVVAGVLLAFLPETKGYPFMETLEDVDSGPNQVNKYTWLGLYSPNKSFGMGKSDAKDVTEPLIR
eukprot:TRINITY_DN14053_c0_g1_i11.p2 TRINITY_DN14053_c0_g1~~TRINITY_DN14053_c0_g1_i11.p2  ORF type:complete len:464 (-),score=39.10 TRINITY_DN14053_c0_g1_i11:366-1757(-)